MKTNPSSRRIFLASGFATAAAALLLKPTPLFAQGILTPPGAPAPTMKTLDQVEPRTPINDTAVPGDADYHHIITQPGSYYLTGNLAVTKTNGIDVRAEGVTLDLNGFEIRRTAGAGGNGIEVDATAHRCTIKNGSLKGFAYGLRCVFTSNYARGGRCLHLSVSGCSESGLLAGEGWQIDGCTAHDNTGNGIDAAIGSTLTNCTATANSAGFAGILASENCTLSNCTATNNTTTYGIFVGNGSALTNSSAVGNTGTNGAGISTGDGCTLTNCSAYANIVPFGINAGTGSTLKNCAARSNTHSNPASGGINAGSGCTLIGCAAAFNTNSNATASPSTGFGIRIDGGSTVRDCTITGNKGDGIQVSSGSDRCHVVGNTCAGNTNGFQGAGIHLTATSNACRIDGNHCAGGTRSFLIEGTDNLIVRNSAQGATVLAYDIVAGNHDAARVISPGAAFASTSPWVNYSF